MPMTIGALAAEAVPVEYVANEGVNPGAEGGIPESIEELPLREEATVRAYFARSDRRGWVTPVCACPVSGVGVGGQSGITTRGMPVGPHV